MPLLDEGDGKRPAGNIVWQMEIRNSVLAIWNIRIQNT